MEEDHLRLLLVEDSDDDAELITRALAGRYALEVSRIDTEEALREALSDEEYDIAITDHLLPGFNSEQVLLTLAELAPGLPCMLVSGKVGEEAVGAAMRQGAVDYVAKDALRSLAAAVERTLAESDRRRERREHREALERSGRLFEAVFVNAHDAMLILDDERRLINANPAAEVLLGRPAEELLKLRFDDVTPTTSLRHARGAWDEFLATGERCGEADLLRTDGALVATEYTLTPGFLPGRHIMVMRDIRERRRAEVQARRHTAQQEAIASFGRRAMLEKHLHLLKQEAVTQVAATLGVETASILELPDDDRAFVVRADHGPGRNRAGSRIPLAAQVRTQASFTLDEGHPVLVEDYEQETRFGPDPVHRERQARSALSVEIPGHPHPYGVLCTASTRPRAFGKTDASFLTAIANVLADALRRAKSEEQIRELALHDPLTGLPNRTLFFDRLNRALTRAERQNTRLAVLFLDIDDFKAHNDTLGHRAADQLLIDVSARMVQTMRQTDTVARFGGDEFVILCEDLADQEEAELLCTRLASALGRPFFLVDEAQHELSASIGVALSDTDRLDGEALLRDADTAMYVSKEHGRGKWTVATREMRLAVVHRSQTKGALETAIGSDQLVLHYQPIVALDGGRMCAVEALVRWEDPERGLVPPLKFVPLAEESELIVRLGEWVLRTACRQAALWRAEFGDEAPLPIHVNLAARQVAQPNLPRLVRESLERYGVPPGDIALEITEGSLIEGTRGPIATLVELKEMGIGVVLDDFGTGYSSLSYLDRFPIDTLKIDRAFVSQIRAPADQAPIVAAIVGMASALAVSTVAEGVETIEQSVAVAALGCNRAQGYFFARPGPASRIAQYLNGDTRLRERAARTRELATTLQSSPEQRA
jgi:diguanylate cyclase (GGDEF)-like protein/PAS domain S-box-containing protein